MAFGSGSAGFQSLCQGTKILFILLCSFTRLQDLQFGKHKLCSLEEGERQEFPYPGENQGHKEEACAPWDISSAAKGLQSELSE